MDSPFLKTFCANCGKELRGRSDKRFCDDSCRNTFNHKLRIPDNEVIAPVVNILRKNRTILVKAFGEAHRIFTRNQLLEREFNFHYCTDRRTLGGSEYYFCFDMGYEIIQDAKYAILSRSYFEFIYQDYLLQLPHLPTGDPDIPEDIAFWSQIREPLHINSEYIEPPPERIQKDPGITLIE